MPFPDALALALLLVGEPGAFCPDAADLGAFAEAFAAAG
jgi:hypothetical protein